MKDDLLELDEVLAARHTDPEALEVIVECEAGISLNTVQEFCHMHNIDYRIDEMFAGCELMRVWDDDEHDL